MPPKKNNSTKATVTKKTVKKTITKKSPVILKTEDTKKAKSSNIKKEDSSFLFKLLFFVFLVTFGASVGFNLQYFYKFQSGKLKGENNLSIGKYEKVEKILSETKQDKLEIDDNIWYKDKTGTIQQVSLKIDNDFWLAMPGPLVPISLIIDSGCEICPDISKDKESLNTILPFAVFNVLDIASNEIPKGLNSIPAILIDKKIKESFVFENLKPFVNEVESGFELEPSILLDVFTKKIIDKNKIPIVDKSANKLAIVGYSAYNCPQSKRFSQEILPQIQEKYAEKIHIEFRHFTISEDSIMPSKAANCAKMIGGNDVFWQMHNLLFENQNSFEKEKLISYASEIGISSDTFADCLEKEEVAIDIASDTEEAESFGVKETPAIFIGEFLITGALDFEVFDQIIFNQLSNE